MAVRTTYNAGSTAVSWGGVDGFGAEYAARIKQLFDASAFPLTAIGGTADAVTATLDPELDSGGLVDGMKFTLTWGAENTGSVTLAINGAAAVPVLDAEGEALVAGAVDAGLRSLIEYIGGSFRIVTGLLIGAGSGSTSNYQVFTTSGTWTKPAGISPDAMVVVELWAGGGGGGSGNNYRSGGGGGAYMRATFRLGDLPASVAVGIGAGGAAGNPGSVGGTSTFGALLTAYGGGGGRSKVSNDQAGPGGGGSHQAGATAATTAAEGAGGEIGGGQGPSGASSTPNGGPATTIWGGGAGGGYNANGGAGGRAVYGGGGGGGQGINGTAGAAGVSIFGGNGGAGGEAGSAPGGGGGGNAAGARGECRVWVV